MSGKTHQILASALELPEAERAQLIDEMLSSFSPRDPQMEELWLAEVRERLAAYESGAIDAIPPDEVFEELGRS